MRRRGSIDEPSYCRGTAARLLFIALAIIAAVVWAVL